jgi:hypothetical protein
MRADAMEAAFRQVTVRFAMEADDASPSSCGLKPPSPSSARP